jgi:hypothetical protein
VIRTEIFKRRVRIFVDDYLRLEFILYAFWTMFWILNGLDKFFNGTLVQGPSGPRLVGWFGVNRDDRFVEYFSRLHLPPWLALGSLYSFAVFEVIVGLVFLALLVRRDLPGFVNRVAFKASMLIFLVFATGDILFGDRAELWEHGTFMILTLMTYQLYLARAQEHADVVEPHRLAETDRDRDQVISPAEYEEFLRRRRMSVLAMEERVRQEEERGED